MAMKEVKLSQGDQFESGPSASAAFLHNKKMAILPLSREHTIFFLKNEFVIKTESGRKNLLPLQK